MKGKRYSKEKKKKNIIKKIIVFIVLIIFITIMIVSGLEIFKWLKENNESKKITEEISNAVVIYEDVEDLKDVDKYDIDFESLKQKNTDTVAWIKVNGTNIEYPVVKAKDNDYYINHSFDKSYNSVGWVFMDYKNKCDGTDRNMVIYAHNRRDGSMFGSLKNILESNWQENKDNLIIPFITENEKEEYQVFSVYTIEKEDYYIKTDFNNDSEFKEFIDKITSRSIKNFNVKVDTKDQILTLSTCADNNKYRVVLHAKKVIQ